ncbi:MAG: DEAD/DEAH box helicase [Elusimicrobia bacterium]|nr:DEAD/DEAH box helicase [Elusimicrobiota bacterium]
MTDTNEKASGGFYGLGIAPKLLETLDGLKFTTPTPIQHKAIPSASEGKDLVGIAQTGTGKTIAFAVPMIQRLAATGHGRGLVLVPTRELALQVAEVVRQFAPVMGLEAAVIIGGESMSRQVQALRARPRIIIATPGRLIDHLGQRTADVSDVRVLVLDEADRMLDMGFAPQIEKVLAAMPRERQTMLFSATMPDDIMKLASRHMKLPIRVEVARPGTAADKVEQELFIVSQNDKNTLLGKLLDKYWGSVLLFVRTKHRAKKITRAIKAMPHTAAEIHSNRSLNQRRDALEGFKSGKYRVLVATDIAARGIDVTGIELVINYDLPDEDGNYVHRIGRTGRAGQPGHAITFAAPDQGADVRNIEKLIRMNLPVSSHPDMPAAKFGDSVPGPGTGGRQPSQPRQPRGQRPQQQPRRPQGEQQPQEQRQKQQQKPRQPQQERQQPRRQEQKRQQQAPRGDEHGGRRPGGRRDERGGRRDQGGRDEARRGGINRYGVDTRKRSSIVSESPYFDEPRRDDRSFRPARSRPAEQAKPEVSGNWFSRFLKRKKD